MWREPPKAGTSKSALEKDSTAAARSSIRRGPSSRHTSSRARRSGIVSSFHTQIIDELRRGTSEPRRVPRFSFITANGASETGIDGMTLEQAEREALSRSNSRSSAPRQTDTASRRHRSSRDQALTDLLGRMDGQPRSSHASPSFTPNFAPAFAYHTSTSSTPSDSGVRLPPMRDRDIHTLPANATFPPDIRDRQSRNTQTRPNRDPAVDGLGDRQRSPSPDGDRDSDAWETLLATITPDATLPSTDTSFNSTSASAPGVSLSVLPRSSVNLPHALPMTMGAGRAHFRLEPYPDTLNPCDFDSSDDDEESPFSYNEFMRRAPSMLPLTRRLPDQHSTMGSHPPVPTIAMSLSDQHQNDDLQHMQVILDRLARREDIPDDWWAAAGLARTLDRGLSASIDSTDNEGPSRTDGRNH